MRSLPSEARASAAHAILRLFLCGALAGWALLAVCLIENISDLGYAVLAGGFWTLTALIAAFGLAGAILGALIGLVGLWQTQAAARPGVASLQLARVRSPRRRHPSNQTLR